MSLALKDILKKKEEMDERANRPQVQWFSLSKKNPVLVRFLQELDSDSPNFDSKFGSVLFLDEHTSPYNYKRRATCTFDSEGRCFACEMTREEREIVDEDGNKRFNPWGKKTNLYIQVVTEDGEVQVLSRPAPGAFFDLLLEEFNEGGESITGRTFRISKGAKKSDPWQLREKRDVELDIPDDVELVDLQAAVERKIPYEDQKKFYDLPEPKTESVAKASTVVEDAGSDW
jgi:hypothetical protein